MDLFEFNARRQMAKPLADRMRPTTLAAFRGQPTAIGPDAMLRRALEAGKLFSMILWGPPGSGKTTLARLVAGQVKAHFVQFSAVLSGVKDIRRVIEEAQQQRDLNRRATVLFVDEIHRFNKAQQDAFLQHVESGLITLIGATTENPSFEVIPALLSRCRVILLHPHSPADLSQIVRRALEDRERGLGLHHLAIAPEALDFLVEAADGDARSALNNLELAATFCTQRASARDAAACVITLQDLENALQRKALRYDKDGEEHYNLISALHKSLRGSDPDAGLYWMARMLAAGEDPLYIARRMVRFASEDIGLADPQALSVALHAMEAFRLLGRPEGELALAEAAVYLATAPKSNAVYRAYQQACQDAQAKGSLPVPLHIRNAPTGLMRKLGYGAGYRYAHDHPEAFVPQDYFPDDLHGRRYYHPTARGYEKAVKARLERWHALASQARSHGGASPPEEEGE
jgi:putative ATPase